jgi:hypothetical protein
VKEIKINNMPIFAMPQLNITFFLSTIIFLTLMFLSLLWIVERKFLPKIATVLKTRKILHEIEIEKNGVEIKTNDTEIMINFVAKVIKNINITK